MTPSLSSPERDASVPSSGSCGARFQLLLACPALYKPPQGAWRLGEGPFSFAVPHMVPFNPPNIPSFDGLAMLHPSPAAQPAPRDGIDYMPSVPKPLAQDCAHVAHLITERCIYKL